jgi:TRAP-type C4-dicarboxylate transport system substrate-binding protein
LPADVRKDLSAALPGYLTALRNGTRDGAIHGRDWLLKEGMVVVAVSPGDRATMRAAAAQIVEKWQKRLDPQAHKIFDKAKQMIDAYNMGKK